ncbi:MAG: hypothetical protein ABI438_06400 [Dermatophilaceae bacterium]
MHSQALVLRWSRIPAVFLALSGLVAAQGISAAPVGAAELRSGLVTDVASDTSPAVPGGQCYPGVPDPSACRRVLDLLHVGNWIYVAGIISSVSDRTSRVTVSGFHNIFRYNAVTHVVDKTWKPQFYKSLTAYTDAPITGLAASPDGSTLYVAGKFNNVAPTTGAAGVQRKGVAAVSTANGSILPFNAKVCSGGGGCVVNDVQLVKGTLWLGGLFTHVNGTAINGLAFVDPISGKPGATQLPISGVVTTTTGTKVAKIAINNQASQAVIIGNFATVGSGTHKEVAVLNISAGGTASVDSWNAPTNLNASESKCSKKDTWARDVDWDPSGTYFDIAASGGGGLDAYPGLCDSLSRFKSDGNPNTPYPLVVNATGFDSEFTVCDTGEYAYIGGHFKSQNHAVRINGVKKTLSGRGHETHYGMAALSMTASDPNYGFSVKAWNNTSVTGRGAGWASCLGLSGSGSSGGGVYIGGDATNVNGDASIQRLAYFPAP